jgi:hypothetical protein
LPAAKPAGWKITDAGLPLKGKASSPAKMPTFSARLSTSHFPGPDTGIVLGLFLSLFRRTLYLAKWQSWPQQNNYFKCLRLSEIKIVTDSIHLKL